MSTHLPLPTFSPFWAKGFEFILNPLRRWHLQGIAFAGWENVSAYEDRPWIWVANHPGNWDGFLLRVLQKRLRPKASIYSIMLDQEIKRRPIFGRVGGIGLKPGEIGHSVQVIRMLRRLRDTQPQCVLSVFPQGQLQPAWQTPLNFKSGVKTIIRAMSPAWVFPIAIRYENLSGLKPTALLSMQRPLSTDKNEAGLEPLEKCIHLGLKNLATLVERYGEQLPNQWPRLSDRDFSLSLDGEIPPMDLRRCLEWWPA